MNQPKVALIIMDGWGYSSNQKGNAIYQAKKPNFDRLWKDYPHTLISASSIAVGLPWGEMGSSEVGHVSLGSGQIIYQDLPRVAKEILTGSFFRNPVLIDALNYADTHKTSLHLIGLLSAGGVHSHIDHLYALFSLMHKRKFRQPSFIHVFTDGRDTPPQVAKIYIEKLQKKIKELQLSTQIASISGRYFAMDRDSHWDRTYANYNCIVEGKGEKASSPIEAIDNAYRRSENDEFIKPTFIEGLKPINTGFLSQVFGKNKKEELQKNFGTVQDNDAVIFFNFRSERMRQLIETFLFPQSNFKDKVLRKKLFISTLTQYDRAVPVNVAFPPEKIKTTLAEILSKYHLTQLHLAETEKYAQVTYFFDGSHGDPYPGEDWKIVPSPKVPTYDQKPEMSTKEIIDELFKKLEQKNYDFVLINFANTDMVGHTGNLPATIKAVEAIDNQLGRLTEKLPNTNFIITADHGNAEEMIDSNGGINTNHSIANVPLILIGPKFKKKTPNADVPKANGILADVAPTILKLLEIPQPKEMVGNDLTDYLI